jgi:DNA-binding CsgD family transcriptional regulator
MEKGKSRPCMVDDPLTPSETMVIDRLDAGVSVAEIMLSLDMNKHSFYTYKSRAEIKLGRREKGHANYFNDETEYNSMSPHEIDLRVDEEIAAGKRCPTCYLLYDIAGPSNRYMRRSDCVPGYCSARNMDPAHVVEELERLRRLRRAIRIGRSEEYPSNRKPRQ